jgi:hypothetical protein
MERPVGDLAVHTEGVHGAGNWYDDVAQTVKALITEWTNKFEDVWPFASFNPAEEISAVFLEQVKPSLDAASEMMGKFGEGLGTAADALRMVAKNFADAQERVRNLANQARATDEETRTSTGGHTSTRDVNPMR